VMLDGLEITQFTYFQQCGGIDLDLVPAELTYGLERLTAFLQVRDSVYDIEWAKGFSYGDVRYREELQYSVYNFEMADIAMLWKLFELHEGEAARLLKLYDPKAADKHRFPLLSAYDQVLKCSNIFNTLDARGAISVTERVGVIQRVRKLAVGVAQAWADQRKAMSYEEFRARLIDLAGKEPSEIVAGITDLAGKEPPDYEEFRARLMDLAGKGDYEEIRAGLIDLAGAEPHGEVAQ